MCQKLREASTELEQGAGKANQIEAADATALEKETEEVKEQFEKLKTAADNYHKFLESRDI